MSLGGGSYSCEPTPLALLIYTSLLANDFASFRACPGGAPIGGYPNSRPIPPRHISHESPAAIRGKCGEGTRLRAVLVADSCDSAGASPERKSLLTIPCR